MLDHLWLPHDISTFGPRVDFLFLLIFWITVIAWVLVTVAMIVFMFKYRSRPGHKASHIEGNPRLELLWTSVTAIILVALALMSRSTWADIKENGPPGVVPNMRLKQDAVPGRIINVWFEAKEPGVYEIPCAELCGLGHSGMKGALYVQSQQDYDAWLKQTYSR
jgi:cytochrome c oxidase subunit 2